MEHKKLYFKGLLITLSFIFVLNGHCQIGINTDTPDSSAVLHIHGEDRGLLIPRIADTSLISHSVADGLIIYNKTENKFQYFNSKEWVVLIPAKLIGSTFKLDYDLGVDIIHPNHEKLTVKGNSEIAGDLNVQGKLSTNDSLVVKGSSAIDGNLKIQGDIKANGKIQDGKGVIVPVGTINAYAGVTAPPGWLLCDGEAYNITQNGFDLQALFNVIDTIYGDGTYDKNSIIVNRDFNVPDFRGQFLRGLDVTGKFDPNTERVLGSRQEDAFQGHQHLEYSTYAKSGGLFRGGVDWHQAVQTNTSRDYVTDPKGDYGTPRVASETRPKNVAVNFIIKYQTMSDLNK